MGMDDIKSHVKYQVPVPMKGTTHPLPRSLNILFLGLFHHGINGEPDDVAEFAVRELGEP